jgi:DNA-binding MarR family transcriptional regulator
MDSADDKQALAAEVWRTMAEFSFAALRRGRHFAILKELGLTPGHMKVLGVLQPGEPRPMGAIAESVGCDASQATWLVDRLEERGLAERRTVPSDRRVKAVVLTPLGEKTKKEVFAHVYEPPKELLSMDRERLESLKQALAHLPEPQHAFSAPAGGRPLAHRSEDC